MLNSTTIQGRFVRDPELRSTQNGKMVTGFTIAWSEKYQETEQKVFLPCVAWGKLAEFVKKYFEKGQECIVEGKLITRQWQDKHGNNRETTELICDRVHFCGPKKESAGSAHVDYSEDGFAEMPGGEDDLPF